MSMFDRSSSTAGGKARFGIKIDVGPWMKKSKRLRGVVESLPVIRLSWAGIGWNGTTNENITEHAIANGDKIWTLTPGTLGEMANEIRDGLVAVATQGQRDVNAEMDEAKDIAYEDIKYNIADGKIDGPERTAWWKAYKAAKWGPNTPNMVASGQWLRSLTAELVEK